MAGAYNPSSSHMAKSDSVVGGCYLFLEKGIQYFQRIPQIQMLAKFIVSYWETVFLHREGKVNNYF
jgi:hypothetical protein